MVSQESVDQFLSQGNPSQNNAPPQFVLPSPVNFQQQARLDLQMLEERENLQKQLVLSGQKSYNAFPLLHFSPYLDDKPIVYSEADVVQECKSSFVDWAVLILTELSGMKVKTRAEVYVSSTSRMDLVWFFALPGGKLDDHKNWIAFAVLEYKNTKMIDVEAFEKAIFHGQEGQTEMELLMQASDEEGATLIEGKSSIWLSQQMTKYAKERNVPFQIAFDFGSMLTLEYGNDLAKGPKFAPENVKIAWMTAEQEVEGTEMTVRAFFLAFLLRALRQTMAKHSITH